MLAVCSYCCRIICHLSLTHSLSLLKCYFFVYDFIIARCTCAFMVLFCARDISPSFFFQQLTRLKFVSCVLKKKMKISLISAPVRCIPRDEHSTAEDSFTWKYVSQLANSAMIDSIFSPFIRHTRRNRFVNGNALEWHVSFCHGERLTTQNILNRIPIRRKPPYFLFDIFLSMRVHRYTRNVGLNPY